MDQELSLFILDSYVPEHAIVAARAGSDLAIAKLPCDTLARMSAFRGKIAEALNGEVDRPTRDELKKYGEELFHLVVRDDVRRLYDRLPNQLVRIEIISNRGELQSLPWEFWHDSPNVPAPRRDR